MILPDVNVLLYAFRQDTSDHPRYRRWLQAVVEAHEGAVESGCEWISTDGDFARFPGLRWRLPF